MAFRIEDETVTLTALEKWERRLRQALDEVDAALEDKYGAHFRLRPNRPQRGSTGNVKYDGLFSVDAKFTLGYTSEFGAGYVVEMRTATDQPISEELREAMLQDVGELLGDALRESFPQRQLTLHRDGAHYRLTGDLGLND
jgi:hypothetical protein